MDIFWNHTDFANYSQGAELKQLRTNPVSSWVKGLNPRPQIRKVQHPNHLAMLPPCSRSKTNFVLSLGSLSNDDGDA